MSDHDKPLPTQIVDPLDQSRQAEVTANREVRVLDLESNSRLLLALLVNANFLKLANFEQVVPSFLGDTITHAYYEDGALIAEARLRFVNQLDWDLATEAYLNDTDGEILLDDDDTRLFLD